MYSNFDNEIFVPVKILFDRFCGAKLLKTKPEKFTKMLFYISYLDQLDHGLDRLD